MDQPVCAELLQVRLNLVPGEFGKRGHDLVKRTAGVTGNMIAQGHPVPLTNRIPFDRLRRCSRRRRIEPFGQDRLAAARSIQNPQVQQPGHVRLQFSRQPLSRRDQSQDQEVMRVEGVQRLLADPLQEPQEVLVSDLSVERQPNLMKVGT